MQFFYENILTIKNCSDKVESICKENADKYRNCGYFTTKLNNYRRSIENDIQIFHEYKKPKRSATLIAFSVIIVVDTIMALVSMFVGPSMSDQAVIDRVQKGVFTNRDIILEMTNIYNDSSEIFKNIFSDNSNDLTHLDKQITDISYEHDRMQTFNDMIHVTTLLLTEHRYHLDTFLDIFNGHPKSILNLIGFKEFVLNLKVLANKIDTNHELPIDIKKQNIMDLFDFCEITATLDEQ